MHSFKALTMPFGFLPLLDFKLRFSNTYETLFVGQKWNELINAPWVNPFKKLAILTEFIPTNKLEHKKLSLSQCWRSFSFATIYHHSNFPNGQQSGRSNLSRLKRCRANIGLSVVARKAVDKPQLGPKYTQDGTRSGDYIGLTCEHRQTWALYEGPTRVKRRECDCEDC